MDDVRKSRRQFYATIWQLFLLPASVLLLAFMIGAPVSAHIGKQGAMAEISGSAAERRSGEGMKSAAAAMVSRGRLQEVRRILPNEWGVPHPVGLSYSVAREQLGLISGDGRVVIITPYEEHVGSIEVAFGVEADVSIAYDDQTGHVLLLDRGLSELGRMAAGADGVPDVDSLTRFGLDYLGLESPVGMDIDERGRRLLILDSERSRINVVEPEPPFALLEKIDLVFLNDANLREVAVHPESGHLFVMGAATETLFELTQQGQLLAVYDLQSLGLVNAEGMDFGPSADLTDEPETVHLFMADSNLVDREPLESEDLSKQLSGAVLEVAIISDRRVHCGFDEK